MLIVASQLLDWVLTAGFFSPVHLCDCDCLCRTTVIAYLCCRYDWFQTDASVTVAIYTRCEQVRRDSVIVELDNQRLLNVAVIVDDNIFHVSQELESEVSPDYKGSNPEVDRNS
jgi:CS domain